MEQGYASLAFSADKNAIVFSSGDASKAFQGGLGLPMLIYYALTLINKGGISYADDVTVDDAATKEGGSENSLGLADGESVKLLTLFSAVTAVGAPDAAIALSRHISRRNNGKSTVAQLKKIAESWEIGKDSVKNPTGRYFDSNPQHFTAKASLAAAREILSFDVRSQVMQNSAVYKDRYISSASMLRSCGSIVRYLCFGEKNSLHAIALAEFGDETVYIAACGANSPIERDAAVLEAVHRARHPSRELDDPWVSAPKSILTIYGNTYCGKRYTK